MVFFFWLRRPLPAAALAFFVGHLLSSNLVAQSPAPPEALPNDHLPPVSAKMNALAHRVLLASVKTNALAGAGLKPWHLKIDFQYQENGNPKPVNGTVEEWAVGPDQWKRIFTGPRDMNFSEWSVSRLERYQTKQREGETQFNPYGTNLRVARPVIDPLYQMANIKPDYEDVYKRQPRKSIASQYRRPHLDERQPGLHRPRFVQRYRQRFQRRRRIGQRSWLWARL